MKLLPIFITMILFFGLYSCDFNLKYNDKEESNVEKTSDEISNNSNHDQPQLKAEIEQSIDAFNKRIDQFEATLKNKNIVLDEEMRKSVDQLKDARDELLNELEEYDNKVDSVGETHKNKVEEKLDQFNQGVEDFFKLGDSRKQND